MPKGTLLVRLPKNRADRRVEKGLIMRYMMTLGRDRFGLISVPYYALTHVGRYHSCSSCDESEE